VSNFRSIISGWKNYLWESPHIELLAHERAKECGKCEHAKHDTVIDFLSDLAASRLSFYYIIGNSLHLHPMDTVYFDALSYDIETDALSGSSYKMNAPASLVRYKWKTRKSVAETIGQYVKETENEDIATSVYDYGTEHEIDLFDETKVPGLYTGDDIYLSLYLAYINKFHAIFTIPMQSEYIYPGTRITLTDNRYDGKTITMSNGFVRNITYDFISKTVEIDIDGTVTTS